MKTNDYPYLLDFIKDGQQGLLTVKRMNAPETAPKFDEYGCLICGVQGGHIRFSVTDVLGDMIINPVFFKSIEDIRKTADRFVYAKSELYAYLDRGEYSMLQIERSLGKIGASYPIVSNDGVKIRYFCENIVQVVFSIVHYCILEGYQFGKCAHCGKWFARKTKKIEYCSGKSPVILGNKNYTHLNCGDAVKNIRQQLKRMRNQIRKNYDYYDLAGDSAQSQYASTFEEQFGSKYQIRWMKCKEDFEKCYEFLERELSLSTGRDFNGTNNRAQR